MTPKERRDLDDVLSLSDEEVAAELRAAGADPTAVGKAGAAIALLAVRNHRLSAHISALESELAEKTARVAELEEQRRVYWSRLDDAAAKAIGISGTVALDRGEAVALREIADAWARYQRRDISQEEFEGTVADRVELHALPALPSEPVKES
jgi:hypothetical protein